MTVFAAFEGALLVDGEPGDERRVVDRREATERPSGERSDPRGSESPDDRSESPGKASSAGPEVPRDGRAGAPCPRTDGEAASRATREPRLTDVSVQCVAAEGETVLAGTFDDGVYRSTDGGETFAQVLGDERVLSVARGHREWWAGTEPSAVYRSADGADWEQLPDLTQLPSSDGWSFPPRPHTHHVRWLEPGQEPGRWYVAIEAGALVRTEDGGETWLDRPEGARRDTHSLATHPDEPGRVYCAAGDGYAESTDGGDTWSYPQAGLDERYCWSVAVPRSDPDVRVVSAARGARSAHRVGDSSVYRKVGDDDWEVVEDLPRGEGAYRAVLIAGEGATLHALSNRGRYRSDDAGTSWVRVAAVPDRFADQPPRGLAVV